MNLIEQDFQQATLLKNLPCKIQKCEYRGEAKSGALQFECQSDSETWNLFLASCIRKEEEFVWKSFEEMLKGSLKACAQKIQGFFGFELIAFQWGDSVQHFNPAAFQQLILNHARILKPGESRVVRFTSLFGILKKRISESFGKMDCAASVTVWSKPPAEWDLWIKKILKDTGGSSTSKILIQDLSSDPLFRFGEEEQTGRLAKLLEDWDKKRFLPEIYLADGRGFIELGGQFGIRKHV